jgi:hypoxanthine phosphoribosyltransferase
MKSYEGTRTTGKVKTIVGLIESVVDRDVVIVEDIVDSGYTMQRLISQLSDLGARSIKVCCLLKKPAAMKVTDLKLDYVALEIPNDFIVGYGLDYNEQGRNLPDIWVVSE